MTIILPTKSLYYNDVNLIAKPAKINSRSEVPLELNRIIVSPMASVIGKEFAIKANTLGLTACLHRFCEPSNQVNIYESLLNKDNVYISVGLNDWDRVKALSDVGNKNWLIDVANGYINKIQDTIDRLIVYNNPIKVMIGNIMTKDGVELYKDYGKFFKGEFYIRTGISGGSACSTSDMTGFNRGQITELIECSEYADEYGIKIVADGGIKNGNYAAKAFGAGCFTEDMVVVTSCGNKKISKISPGDTVKTHTNCYKTVKRIYKYKYSGKLLNINGIRCTPTHEFYAINEKYKNIINDSNIHEYAEWIKAETLTTEYFLIKMGKYVKLIEIQTIKDEDFDGYVYDLEVDDDHSYNIDSIIVHNSDYVMMGSYFAKAKEAHTHIIGDGTYWGGASHKQQKLFGGIKKHSEGKVIKIEDDIKPLEELVSDLWGGLSSAVSYGGCKTLTEFIGNGVFEVKQNSLPPKRN